MQQGERFQGFAVVCMRNLKGRFDPEDDSADTWRGGSIAGYAEPHLAREGLRIVGFHRRSISDIDALGLMERRPATADTEET